MQINITGFLNGKNARVFMKELWELLLSAQNNIGGIPSAFLEKKKEEIRQRKVLYTLIFGLFYSPPCMQKTRIFLILL